MSPRPTPSAPITLPTPIKTDNLERVTSLHGLEQCLWNHGLFPAGGTGYRDSSLPYDDLPPVDAARHILRAQVMRTSAAVISDVSIQGNTVEIVLSTSGRRATLASILARDAKAATAYRTLRNAKVPVILTARPGPALSRLCLWEERLPLRDSGGGVLRVQTDTDPATGRSRVVVFPEDLTVARAAARGLDDVVEIIAGDVQPNLWDEPLHWL